MIDLQQITINTRLDILWRWIRRYWNI